jgi:hypothetical protein
MDMKKPEAVKMMTEKTPSVQNLLSHPDREITNNQSLMEALVQEDKEQGQELEQAPDLISFPVVFPMTESSGIHPLQAFRMMEFSGIHPKLVFLMTGFSGILIRIFSENYHVGIFGGILLSHILILIIYGWQRLTKSIIAGLGINCPNNLK